MHELQPLGGTDRYRRIMFIDKRKGEIFLDPEYGSDVSAEARFRVLNLLEELDTPGEWYLDRATGMLYFWPPAPLLGARVEVSHLRECLVLVRAAYVTLRDFIFECTRGDGISIGGDDTTVCGGTIRNLGGTAAFVSGTGVGLDGVRIYGIGGGGSAWEWGRRGYCVQLRSWPPDTLTLTGAFVRNCDIHSWGTSYVVGHGAIAVGGCGNIVTNNRIHDGPLTAIELAGNDHRVEYNEIRRLTAEAEKGAAIRHVGCDWTMRGTCIRHNVFRDLPDGIAGVRLDMAASGTDIVGNAFLQVRDAVVIGGGRDNTIDNNLFLGCVPGVRLEALLLYRANDRLLALHTKLRERKAREWSLTERYPQLTAILDDEPTLPKGNALTRNISAGGAWLTFGTPEAEKALTDIGSNLVGADPHFVDPEQGDYRLREDSPAAEIGFEPIPWDLIGPNREPATSSR